MRIKKYITLFIVSLLSLSLFASGTSESTLVFSSLDFSSLDIEEIEKNYETAKENYFASLEKLDERIKTAAKEKNIDQYLTLLSLKDSLEYPTVTKEITETLIERMLKSTSLDEKNEIASFLYENSNYYAPTLTLCLKYENSAGVRTYSSAIAVKPGTKITLPSSTSFYSSIIKGWGITEDEVLYTPGEEIEMPYTDTILYGVLSSGISFSDDVTGFSYVTEENTAEVTVPDAPSSSYIFAGWYDTITGEEIKGDTVTVEEGESKSYKAYWKSITLSPGTVKYYSDCVVPASTQLKFTSTLLCGGNCSLRDVTVTLEETEGLRVLSKDKRYHALKSGDKVNLEYVVVLSGESGDKIETTLTALDGEGNVWSLPVTFTIK